MSVLILDMKSDLDLDSVTLAFIHSLGISHMSLNQLFLTILSGLCSFSYHIFFSLFVDKITNRKYWGNLQLRLKRGPIC